MSPEDMARVLAKVQLVDNREVSKLVILEWLDIIGDLLTYGQAIDAVRRFRRERPGVYLEAGHLLELAGVAAGPEIPDVTQEVIEESKVRALAAAGVTEAEVEAHAGDVAWLRAHFPASTRELEPIHEGGWPV